MKKLCSCKVQILKRFNLIKANILTASTNDAKDFTLDPRIFYGKKVQE